MSSRVSRRASLRRSISRKRRSSAMSISRSRSVRPSSKRRANRVQWASAFKRTPVKGMRIHDGKNITFSKYAPMKHNSSLEKKVIEAITRPASIDIDNAVTIAGDAGLSLWDYGSVGSQADLNELAETAGLGNSGGTFTGYDHEGPVQIMARNSANTYSNITEALSVYYEVFYMVPRYDTNSSPQALIASSILNMPTALTTSSTDWAGSSNPVFTAQAGPSTAYNASLALNIFDCREFTPCWKVINTAKGRIEPGKSITINLSLKPQAYNHKSARYVSGVSYNTKFTQFYVIKFYGDIAYGNISHLPVEGSFALMRRQKEYISVKKLPVYISDSERHQVKRSGFRTSSVGDTVLRALNDENDQASAYGGQQVDTGVYFN